MKIDELIAVLEQIKEHDNFEVAMLTDTPNGEWHFDEDFQIDVVEPETDEGRGDPVCVIAWSHCLPPLEEAQKAAGVEEDKPMKKRSHLKLLD